MINRAKILGVALASALGASSALAAHPGFYIGAGGGEATAKDKLDVDIGTAINPDIERIELDKNETGWKGFVGYNFLPWLGVEAGYTVLGQPSEDKTFLVAPPVNETKVELSNDLTAWQGFLVGILPIGPVDIFGKIGWANLSTNGELKTNSPNATPTPFSTKTSNGNDDSMAVYGGGAAINFGHWAIRGEYEAYDASNLDDLYFVSGSLVYTFFENKKPTPVAAPAPAPMPPPKPAPAVAAKCPDGDKDGVCDAVDQCPTTPAGARVGPSGCDCDYSLQLHFATNSAELSADDKAEIDKIVPVLKNPKVAFIAGEIDGYTDNTGEAAYNLGLSQRRADSVAAYAKSQGVTLGDRFATHGYGEDYPVASNDTADGRAQNRRVVLRRTDCGPAH